jgi:hypothetical protein
MNLITSCLLGVAGCLVMFYSGGGRIRIIWQDEQERRDSVWFVVIAGAMLLVLALWASRGSR